VTVLDESMKQSTDSAAAAGERPRSSSQPAVLVVHNFYQQPGGEDQVFKDEVELLRSRGHAVSTFTVHNDEVAQLGKLSLARKTLWNRDTYDRVSDVVRREKPAIVHFHNTFPLVSPAAYYAARDNGASVVQTLHNYRLLCPAATFFRDGGVCEDCLGKSVPWPGVVHKCYRDNRAASAMTAAMLSYHRMKRTWRDVVNVYIALTDFAKSKFVQGGLPADKLVVKPNFVDPAPTEVHCNEGSGSEGRYVVFVGRLSPEKGISTLLNAWKSGLTRSIRLKILGDGPLRPEVTKAAAALPNVEYLGRRGMAEVFEIVGNAEALIFPSLWYEGLPRTIIESFACGTPIIASNLGSMSELVQPGRSGRLFEAGNADDLARQVGELLSNAAELSELRRGARQEYLRAYTADQNYPMLMEAYRQARVCA
jgi:glycosyltransferase involved in cell wall biosynthesis